MAKIEFIKARKEYTCSKCKGVINKGSSYYKGSPYMQKPVIRCAMCGLKHWELSSSDFIRDIGCLQSDWQKDYGTQEGVWDDIRDALEEVRDRCEERLDNMPDSLRDADTGTLLQDRIEMLEDAMNELDTLSMCEFVDDAYNGLDEDQTEEIDSLIKDADISDAYDSLIKEHSENDTVQELMSEVESSITERIDDILSYIET